MELSLRVGNCLAKVRVELESRQVVRQASEAEAARLTFHHRYGYGLHYERRAR